mmetsp:Transcript_28177/g.72400  ORF Transcript_28177/g.72400 Transcript_28177/m.72400 type:complete len:281 (+) Transcript_28177:1232-2074(+)
MQLRALAAAHRPAAAGHPVDQEARGEARPQGMSSRAEDAHGPAVAGHRERHPGDHREHPADRRRGAQPGHRPPDDQARPQPRDQAGRQGDRPTMPQGRGDGHADRRPPLPHLPADQAAQPALHPRDPGADDPGQLHRDREGPRGPAARAGGREGAAGARGGEVAPDPRGGREQAAAQGDRGQDFARALRIEWQHPRRPERHRHPRLVQAHLERHRAEAADRRGDDAAARQDARGLPAGRVPLVDPLLLHLRHGQRRPDVPVLARVVRGPLPALDRRRGAV